MVTAALWALAALSFGSVAYCAGWVLGEIYVYRNPPWRIVEAVLALKALWHRRLHRTCLGLGDHDRAAHHMGMVVLCNTARTNVAFRRFGASTRIYVRQLQEVCRGSRTRPGG